MSQRIHSWHLLSAIGFRSVRVDTTPEFVGKLRCIRFDMTRRSLSRRVSPRHSSVQLGNSLWRLTNLTRNVRKYLGAGKSYTALEQSRPTQGMISPIHARMQLQCLRLIISTVESIQKAVLYWKSLSTTSALSKSSYKSSADLYNILRQLHSIQNITTLTPDDVRSALKSMASLGICDSIPDGIYPKEMFLDLLAVWDSPWRTKDYNAIFEILMWNGTFEESISTMKIIYERKDVKQYPDADCWTRLLDGLRLHPNIATVRKCKEAWYLMRQCGAEPSIATFNAVFGAICSFGDAFEFILDLYKHELLPSNSPNHVTLRCLLEGYMTQMPTPQVLAEGNTLFDQLLDYKQSKSSPQYWNPIIKWMLFRGDSLSVIKHALYEQSSVLGRDLRPQLDEAQNTSLSKTIPDYRHSDTVATTLDQLIELALCIGKVDSATTIYDDFFPSLHVTPTIHTDKLMLELLIRRNQAEGAKSIYDELRYQGHRVPANTVVRLINILAQGHRPPAEAQSVFFDLLDDPECAPETSDSAFSRLASFLVGVGDYPRLRQTLQDRTIDRVPKWRSILSSVCLEVLSDPRNIWLEPLLPVYHIVQRWAPSNITLSHRHTLMHKLISQGRTDLGLELFHDMRHSDISQPTRETYAVMLAGCGKTRDAQTLEHIHNALRLDSSIEPDSALFNLLMLAYNRSQLPEKSLAIWDVLSQSSRRPDVETASLALEACVRLPRYGLLRARGIWTFMENNDMDPPSSSYAALLTVFASVGKWDGMMGLLESMERVKVDAMVLGTAYNNMRRDRKEEVERWARTNRPEVWEYLDGIN